MGGIGYALGSILTGAGEGLAAQAQSDIASRREIALEKLRSQDQSTAETQRAASAEHLAGVTADLADRNAGRNDARDFAYGSQTNEQKQGYEQQNIKLKAGIDLSHDETLAQVQHKYHLEEDQAHDLREIAARAQQDNTLIDHYEVDKYGHMVGFTKTGRAYQSQTNQYPYSGESSSDDGGGSISAEAAARGGKGGSPARASAGRGTNPKPSSDSSALSQLANLPPPPGGRVGATATGPNGLKATWNGKRWVLADQNGE